MISRGSSLLWLVLEYLQIIRCLFITTYYYVYYTWIEILYIQRYYYRDTIIYIYIYTRFFLKYVYVYLFSFHLRLTPSASSPITNPLPDDVTPESYNAVIPPHPPESRGPYFRRAPCFLRPLPRLFTVSLCLFQVSKNKQEHKRNHRQSSGADCKVERQRGRD